MNQYRLLSSLATLVLVTSITAGEHPTNRQERYRNQSLIVINATSIEEAQPIIKRISEVSGNAAIAMYFPPNVIVGRIEPGRHDDIRRLTGVETVTAASGGVHPRVTDLNARMGLQFFDDVANGGREFDEARFPPQASPLQEDVRTTRPNYGLDRFLPVTESHTGYQNDQMLGRIAVAVFYVESNGASDPNEFTWTAAAHNATAYRIIDGLDWWGYVASQHLGGWPLLYTVRFDSIHTDANHVLQPYEPIRHASTEDYLWVNEIMSNLGYTQFAYTLEERAKLRVAAFNEDWKAQTGADQGFSVFVSYNPPSQGAPGAFTDGRTAGAWLGGPFLYLLYRNGGYSEYQTGEVFGHEMGHTFWSCDEYAQQCDIYPNCQNCYAFGPRPQAMNWNCEKNCAEGHSVSCVMKYFWDGAWSSHLACPHTKGQIGW